MSAECRRLRDPTDTGPECSCSGQACALDVPEVGATNTPPTSGITTEEASLGDKEIASRLWGMLMVRLTPLQIRALHRIHQAHPTTNELATALEISPQHAGGLALGLYRQGLLRRERAGGRQYRWFPAFRPPLPFHYFDRAPVALTVEAAQRADEIILRRRGKL